MKLTYAILATAVLTGCQSTDDWYSDEDTEPKSSIQSYSEMNRTVENEMFNGHKDADEISHWARNPHSYLNSYKQSSNNMSGMQVSDYVEAMAFKLIKNMQYVTPNTPVAVASFVPVDSNLEETNLLGLHLTENFVHQAQQLGLSVIDYKSTGTIRVTETGDFTFSRDIDELRQWHPIEYVLSGTFTVKDTGVEVHARMVGIESRVVVASAMGFIPNVVANKVRSYGKKDGISLTKG
jgi:TolB-like protein